MSSPSNNSSLAAERWRSASLHLPVCSSWLENPVGFLDDCDTHTLTHTHVDTVIIGRADPVLPWLRPAVNPWLNDRSTLWNDYTCAFYRFWHMTFMFAHILLMHLEYLLHSYIFHGHDRPAGSEVTRLRILNVPEPKENMAGDLLDLKTQNSCWEEEKKVVFSILLCRPFPVHI